jgi:hypothetical protein
MSNTLKNRGPDGRNRPHEPTDEYRRQVEMLAGIGVPETMICRVIGISKPTLEKHYRDDLETGRAKAATKIAKRLYDIAMGDGRESLTACIFWLKCRAGWSTLDPAPQINIQNNTAVIESKDKAEILEFRKRWESATLD